MKKKIIIVMIAVIFVLLILLVPQIRYLNDGGTIEYKAVLYSITKLNKLNYYSVSGYDRGTKIEILGKEVYNDIVIAEPTIINIEDISKDEEQHEFIGTIIETTDNSIVVVPDAGTNERKSSDKISMKITRLTSGVIDFYVKGNKVKITYNGVIMESYPAQIVATKIELAS